MGKFGGWIKGIVRKPITKIVAPAIGIGAALNLLKPMANGDGVINRLNTILASLQPGQTPNILAQDSGGNNILSIAAAQLQANAIESAFLGVGAAITYKIGKIFGM